jgi:hypothetical protein
MSEILTLAADFIDRMSNPAHGIAVNEEYSLRFAQLLGQERTFSILRDEAARVRDVNTLSAHGWFWFLNWARGHELELNGELLLDLSDRWASVFMQVLIIDVATRNRRMRELGQARHVAEFQDEWLRQLLTRSVIQEQRPPERRNEPEEGHSEEQVPVRMGRAETTLLALLQVGSDLTLAAAATLLAHPWPGRGRLREYYEWRLSDLEPETRAAWEQRIRLME